MSIEKEVFPHMASDGELFAMVLNGYWMDIGQPKDFLAGMQMHMDWLVRQGALKSSVVIDPTARVEEGAELGPGVVVGPHAVVERGARVVRSCVMEGSVIRAHSVVLDSIVGWRSTVESWSFVNKTVLGEDVCVGSMVCLNGATVLPHKTVGESIWVEGRIIM